MGRLSSDMFALPRVNGDGTCRMKMVEVKMRLLREAGLRNSAYDIEAIKWHRVLSFFVVESMHIATLVANEFGARLERELGRSKPFYQR